MDLFEKFFNTIAALEDRKVEYILIGGFAVVLHGMPRTTQDIDIFIRPEKNNIEKLKEALHSVFNDPSINEISLEELQKYPVIRYGTPDGFSIDLIANLGEAFSFDDIEFEFRQIEGLHIKIATPKALFEMKKNTFRESDQIDVNFLMDKINQRGKDGH